VLWYYFFSFFVIYFNAKYSSNPKIKFLKVWSYFAERRSPDHHTFTVLPANHLSYYSRMMNY